MKIVYEEQEPKEINENEFKVGDVYRITSYEPGLSAPSKYLQQTFIKVSADETWWIQGKILKGIGGFYRGVLLKTELVIKE